MKKAIYFICLMLVSAGFLIGYSNINSMINVNKEKIGNEYIVLADLELAPNDSHGTVKNYQNSFRDNIWTTTFDYMNSTGYQHLEIHPEDTLEIESKLKSGSVWIKITQGDLIKSEIQKLQVLNNETVTIDLSHWEAGEICIWLVVENGENGMIQIEHIGG